MKTRYVVVAALLAAFINASVGYLLPRLAYAHTGSPAPTTWSDGDQLNATDLNNTIAHLHNTFTGGIVDAHVSASAALAHSKLATPSLVPKAYLSTITVCDGAAAAGTNCANVESTGFDTGTGAAESTGTAGTYQFNLNYTPATSNFAVLATGANLNTVVCYAAGGNNTSKPHFMIYCRNQAGTLTNTAFSVLVLDQ